MEQIDLCGTGVALVTPFNEDLTVDFQSLGKVIDHVISGGADYLVVMGTTGESVTLNKDEKKHIVQYIIEKNNKRLPMVLGIGGNNTLEVTESINSTDLSAFGAVLSVSPYYNKPNQEGIYQHYKFIAENTNAPLILYNVPGRTGKNIEAKTTLRLANDFNNIIAIKEASGDMAQAMKILKDKPKNFKIISGDDALTLPIMAMGGCGVISVIANAFTVQFSKMVNYAISGNITEARKLHYTVFEMIGMLFEEGSPSGIKAALNRIGLCKDFVRLPLVPVSKSLNERIVSLTEKLNVQMK